MLRLLMFVVAAILLASAASRAAARQVDRPVKLVLTRAQMYTSTGYRSETIQDLKLGARRDGTLTAIVHESTSIGVAVGEFPEMVFVGRSIEPLGDRSARLTGELTLLGVTRPLTLEVRLNKAGRYPFLDEHYAIGIDARGTLLLGEPEVAAWRTARRCCSRLATGRQ